MQGSKILIIEDDLAMQKVIKQALSGAGAQVIIAGNGEEGLRQFYEHQPDLVILDIILPGMDGWEVCSQIRELSDAPIMMLTGQVRDDDIVRGLDMGADDYLVKPFSVKVLVAHARAALRRGALLAEAAKKTTAYDDGYLAIDLETRRVSVRGEPIRLSAREHHLLAYLLQHAGQALSFKQILENVWGWEYQDSDEYVRVYVWHLRQKIEEDPHRPQYLLNEHGIGYRFEKRLQH